MSLYITKIFFKGTESNRLLIWSFVFFVVLFHPVLKTFPVSILGCSHCSKSPLLSGESKEEIDICLFITQYIQIKP
ncbi:hypothetical protein Hanom_Chr09g00830171 [Helianthus anomalus]